MTIFIKLKTLILILSKLLSLLFCIYVLYNYDQYKLGFNLPIWLREYTFVGSLNDFLDYIGISFLIIPFTITLTSLFFPEVKWLNIISVILSISTNAFTLGIAFMRGTLQDFINMKFFTLYHISSFEDKRSAFLSLVNKYLEDLNPSFDKAKYMQECLNKYYTLYETNIRNTPMSKIPEYAKQVVEKAMKEYETINKTKENTSETLSSFISNISVSGCLKVAGFVFAGYVVYKLYCYLFGVDTTIAKAGLEAAKEGQILTEEITVRTQANINTDTVVQNTVGVLPDLLNKILTLQTRLEECTSITNRNAEVLEKVQQSVNRNIPDIKTEISILQHRVDNNTIQASLALPSNEMYITETQLKYNKLMAQTIEETREQLKKQVETLGETKKQVEWVQKQAELLVEKTKINTNNTAKVNKSIIDVQENVETHYNNMDKHLNLMEKTLSSQVVMLEKQVSGHDTNIEALTLISDRYITGIKGNIENMKVLEDKQSSLNVALQSMYEKQDMIEKLQIENKIQLELLENKMNSNSVELNYNVNNLIEKTNSLSKAKGKEKIMDSEVSSNSKSVNALNSLMEFITDLRREQKVFQSQVEQQQQELEQQQKRIDLLESKNNNIHESSGTTLNITDDIKLIDNLAGHLSSTEPDEEMLSYDQLISKNINRLLNAANTYVNNPQQVEDYHDIKSAETILSTINETPDNTIYSINNTNIVENNTNIVENNTSTIENNTSTIENKNYIMPEKDRQQMLQSLNNIESKLNKQNENNLFSRFFSKGQKENTDLSSGSDVEDSDMSEDEKDSENEKDSDDEKSYLKDPMDNTRFREFR